MSKPVYIVLDGKQNVKRVASTQKAAQAYADRLKGLAQVCRVEPMVKGGKLCVTCSTTTVRGAIRR